MKKISLLTFFILCIAIFSPSLIYAATMEITVTINSFQVPERAAMATAVGYPNTEVMLDNARIVITNNNIVNSVKAFTSGELKQGAILTINFPYDSALATQYGYKVHVENQVNLAGGIIACKADCTNIPANTPNTYVTYDSLYYKNYTPNASSLACPATVCSGWYYRIAVSTSSVFGYSDSNGIAPGTSYYYWRSPAIFTIN